MRTRTFIVGGFTAALLTLTGCPGPDDDGSTPVPTTSASSASAPATRPTTTRPAPSPTTPVTTAPTRTAPATTKPPTTPTTDPADDDPPPREADTDQTYYRNCTQMREDHPNGVGRNHPAYRSGLDRDDDGRACETN